MIKLYDYISRIKFISPPKPFKDVDMLNSGFFFNGVPSFFILITTSYIYIKMPELGLDLIMPQWDLSSLFDRITSRTGVAVPTMNNSDLKIVDFSRFANNFSERALQGSQFVPHNWPHLSDYSRLILVHISHPLFKLSLAGIIWLVGQRLHALLSSLPSIIPNLSCISKSSISDYFKLKIVKFKDTFSKSINCSRYALDKVNLSKISPNYILLSKQKARSLPYIKNSAYSFYDYIGNLYSSHLRYISIYMSSVNNSVQGETNNLFRDIDRFLSQIRGFIDRFNNLIITNNINVIQDVNGDLSFDVPADMDAELAQRLSNTMDLINSLIHDRVHELELLFESAYQIEQPNSEFSSILASKKAIFDALVSSYPHI